MISYFSGTGDLAAIAKRIAAGVENEQINFILEFFNTNSDLSMFKN